jgi:hypothetical protein
MARPAVPIRLVQFLLRSYQADHVFGVIHILSVGGDVCCATNYYPPPKEWEIHEPRDYYQATCKSCLRIVGRSSDPA